MINLINTHKRNIVVSLLVLSVYSLCIARIPHLSLTEKNEPQNTDTYTYDFSRRGKEKVVLEEEKSGKEIIKGDVLFIKGKGAVCKNLRVGKNILVGDQICFNNRCTPMLVKGAKEENLLNLRSTICFACNPGLDCSLDNNCGEAICGCLNSRLHISACQTDVKRCAGFGINAEKSDFFISGTSAVQQFAGDPHGFFVVSQVVTHIQIQVVVPISYCALFKCRPSIQVTYDKNTLDLKNDICVADEDLNETMSFPPGTDPDADPTTTTECVLRGCSITTLLGQNAYIQNVSQSGAFIIFTISYVNNLFVDNAFGVQNPRTTTPFCKDEVARLICLQQKKAIKKMCKHANDVIKSTNFDVIVEGPVL